MYVGIVHRGNAMIRILTFASMCGVLLQPWDAQPALLFTPARAVLYR